MTKEAKVLIATAAAALTIGGLAPMAHAEQKSYGQKGVPAAHERDGRTRGTRALRLVQRAIDAAF